MLISFPNLFFFLPNKTNFFIFFYPYLFPIIIWNVFVPFCCCYYTVVPTVALIRALYSTLGLIRINLCALGDVTSTHPTNEHIGGDIAADMVM